MATLELVRAGLVARAPEVAIALVGEPNRGLSSKRELRFGRHGSMALVITGPKAGLWHDHEIGDGGDMLALVMRERRVGFADAVDYAAGLLALPRQEWPRDVRQARQDKPAAAEAPDMRECARCIWQASQAIEGTPAQAYLQNRGLEVNDGVSGRVLRYHAACPFHRVEDGKKIHVEVPALVALFRSIVGDEPMAIMRTAITLDGRKADLSPAKLSLGPADGSAVKLSANDEVTIGLTLAEGIETALAGLMLGFAPAWALCSSGRIRTFPVLPGVEALTVLVDHDDEAKSKAGAGQVCARQVSKVWTAAGREVLRVVPDLVGQDMADLVK
jgi:putative DNA primase/helicase